MLSRGRLPLSFLLGSLVTRALKEMGEGPTLFEWNRKDDGPDRCCFMALSVMQRSTSEKCWLQMHARWGTTQFRSNKSGQANEESCRSGSDRPWTGVLCLLQVCVGCRSCYPSSRTPCALVAGILPCAIMPVWLSVYMGCISAQFRHSRIRDPVESVHV